VRGPDGWRTREPRGAVSGVGPRSALRRECGEGDIRSGAGLCDGREVPARAAAVLVTPTLGLEPFAVAVRRHSRTLAQLTFLEPASPCCCNSVMARMAAIAGLAALLALSLLAAPSAGAFDPWAKLRRPLHIPHIAPGSPCPVTPARRVSPSFGTRPAQGPGPVYPIGGFPTLTFTYPPQRYQLWYGSSWSGNKVLWIARPSYRGRVLIRGRQLDGSRDARFGSGLNPSRELRLSSVGGSSAGGWQNRPSYTRLRVPGCYAWQVDGTTFSRVIVFKAVLAS
jgi:hypothetical protein